MSINTDKLLAARAKVDEYAPESLSVPVRMLGKMGEALEAMGYDINGTTVGKCKEIKDRVEMVIYELNEISE